MRILQFTAENFKKIRVVEITPKGRITTVTGRNGQGKTSVLDALWALFGGRRAMQDKPVRKGAANSKLSATLSDENGKPYLIAKRTIAADRTTTLTIEAAPGATRPAGTPQAVLDALIGEMSFDPIAFIRMDPKKQVEILRRAVKVEVDLDELTEANRIDYGERTIINRDVDQLRAQVTAAIFAPGLPAEKIDEAEILARIEQANADNRNMAARIQTRIRLAEELKEAEEAERKHRELIRQQETLIQRLSTETEAAGPLFGFTDELMTILSTQQDKAGTLHMDWVGKTHAALGTAWMEAERLQERLVSEMRDREANEKQAQKVLKAALNLTERMAEAVELARQAVETAPTAEMIDTQALMEELETARRTNREIDKRARHEDLTNQLRAKEQEAANLTRKMEAREEQKREALANAKMPVEGLTFNEDGVLMKGIPLEQLGEAEQIRVGCALAMATAPQLRCLPIAHGESMDSDSLALIEKLAEENDFQIFMSKVDTSGKVGIVIEDGMVVSRNEE